MEGEINARHFRSGPYSKPYREHRDFLCRGAAVFAAFGSTHPAATDSYSHPPFAFDATSGTDVPHPRRHFPGHAAAVRVSGRIWRSDNPAKVFRREYIIAIAASVGRPKDLARIEQLLEQAKIDRPMLDDILRRYNLKLPTK